MDIQSGSEDCCVTKSCSSHIANLMPDWLSSIIGHALVISI